MMHIRLVHVQLPETGYLIPNYLFTFPANAKTHAHTLSPSRTLPLCREAGNRDVWFSDGGKIPRDRVFLSCSFRRRVSRGELRGASGWFSIGGLPTRVQPSRSSRHSFLWPQTLPRCQPSHTSLAYLTRPAKTGCYGIGSVLLA